MVLSTPWSLVRLTPRPWQSATAASFMSGTKPARAPPLAGTGLVQEVDLGGRCALPGPDGQPPALHVVRPVPAGRGRGDRHAVGGPGPGAHAGSGARRRGRGSRDQDGTTTSGGPAALPDRLSLDEAAPRNPVMLEAKSGHALWVNSLALQKAGIRLDTADPEGGKIVHDGTGVPSGILLENAMRLVQAVIPRPSAGELARMMRRAQTEAHRRGLTGIHDFDRVLAFEALQELRAAGELSLRVVKGIPHEMLSQAISLGIRTGFGDEHAAPGGREDVCGWRLGAADGLDDRSLRGHAGRPASRRWARSSSSKTSCAPTRQGWRAPFMPSGTPRATWC